MMEQSPLHTPQHTYESAFSFMHNGSEWVIDYQVSDDTKFENSSTEKNDEKNDEDTSNEESKLKKQNNSNGSIQIEESDKDRDKQKLMEETMKSYLKSSNKQITKPAKIDINMAQRLRMMESRENILTIIRKAEEKRIGKTEIITFLKKKGAEIDKICDAYLIFYEEKGLYEITFNDKPLGFSIRQQDNKGINAIVSSISNNVNKTVGLKIGHKIYEINGQRVDNTNFNLILKCIKETSLPCYIVFKK